jgi:hypothetical protein
MARPWASMDPGPGVPSIEWQWHEDEWCPHRWPAGNHITVDRLGVGRVCMFCQRVIWPVAQEGTVKREDVAPGLAETLQHLVDEYGFRGVAQALGPMGGAHEVLRPAGPVDLICMALGVDPANVVGGTVRLEQGAVVVASLDLVVEPPKAEPPEADPDDKPMFEPAPIPGNRPVNVGPKRGLA